MKHARAQLIDRMALSPRWAVILGAALLIAIQPATAVTAKKDSETAAANSDSELLRSVLAGAQADRLPASELQEFKKVLALERRRLRVGQAFDDVPKEHQIRGAVALGRLIPKTKVPAERNEQGIVVGPDYNWDDAHSGARARDDAKAEAVVVGKHAEQKEPKAVPIFDAFMFVYWGVVVVVGAAILWPVAKLREKMMHEPMPDGTERNEPMPDLSENLWSLNVVAALGEARLADGREIHAGYIAALSLFMASIQICALMLMAMAIDPYAKPVTTEPSSPWLQGKSGFQVNLMKWLMVIFLTVGQIGEVKQCQKVATCAVKLHHSRLRVSRVVPIGAAMLQYLVSNIVIFAGVATVLSFQTAPDIIYSSMSVFFITGADEMFYECIQSIFEIDASFECVMGSGGEHSVKTLDAIAHEDKPLDTWLYILFKILQVFPLFLGFLFIGRAWYTGIMPTNRFELT